MKKDKSKDSQPINSHVAETYEHVKYFEKQRGKQNLKEEGKHLSEFIIIGNGSIYGEKLSFKGRLASSKCDDSVINCQIGEATNQAQNENEILSRSNVDDKPFSFKNISSKMKNMNDEHDTINDVLNSPNASQKSDIKARDHQNDYEKLVSQGFSNIQKLKDKNSNKEKFEGTKSLVSFGENIHLNNGSENIRHLESPKKSNMFAPVESNGNSRMMKNFIDEGPNCSMLGMIDDNSSKIEHNYMFLNDKTNNSRFIDKTASMIFENQHSNSFLGLNGTPNKYEASQNYLFDQNASHSNISALFPNIQQNASQKKILKNFNNNENSQIKKPEVPVKPKRQEVPPAVQPFIGKPALEISQKPSFIEPQQVNFTGMENNKFMHDNLMADFHEEVKHDHENTTNNLLPSDPYPSAECSLPHPTKLFGIKDLNMYSPSNKSKKIK